jgi:DNA-binding GntR family transcriptional regulator
MEAHSICVIFLKNLSISNCSASNMQEVEPATDLIELGRILAPSPKRSLADNVVVNLREAISARRLPPGARLHEQMLAVSMNVSRGPIREALSQLEREGLVIKQQNRGVFVARLSADDLDEVYSLRLSLELLAVKRAIHNLEPEMIATMQSVIDTMASYVDRGMTIKEAADLDMQFHELIYRASKHRRLYDSWSTLSPQIRILLLNRNLANADFRELAVNSHQVILDAIKARDEAQAVAIVEHHLRFSYERVAGDYESRNAATDAEAPR